MPENKLLTVEFEKCVQDVMKQGHEKGSAFAICTATFQRGGKPIHVGEAENQKLHLFSESISIAGNKVSGVAIHPRRIFHPEENVTHVYLREELEKAAPTLIGKPFGIDHQYVLPPPNLITNAWYDSKENGVAFEGIVEDKIAEQIRNQVFKGLSIELDWLKPGGKIEYVDGIAPRNFELTSVHLLKKFPPGDRDAFIKLWNGIMEQLVMGPALPLDRRVEAVEKQIHEIFNQIAVINGKLEVMIGKEPSQTSLTPQMQETEWTAEYIGSLPDTAFAVISPGGEKDKQSKTVPRSLRHLPHHNAQGDTDLPHLRNALSRLPQTNLSSEEQSEAKRHLCAHANELGIISDVCELEPRIKESEDIVALRKKVFNLQVKLGESEKISQALKKRHADFRKLVESVIPQPSIFGAWRPGSRLMIQQLQRILRESSDSVNASHGQAEWRDRKY